MCGSQAKYAVTSGRRPQNILCPFASYERWPVSNERVLVLFSTDDKLSTTSKCWIGMVCLEEVRGLCPSGMGDHVTCEI